MKINESQWKPMKTNENQWKSMKTNGNQWKTVKIQIFHSQYGSCRDHSECSMIMLGIEKLLETLQSSHTIPQMQFWSCRNILSISKTSWKFVLFNKKTLFFNSLISSLLFNRGAPLLSVAQELTKINITPSSVGRFQKIRQFWRVETQGFPTHLFLYKSDLKKLWKYV